MGWYRNRNNLRRKKKMYKKKYFQEIIKQPVAKMNVQQLPDKKLNSYMFQYEAENFLLPNGDMIDDTIQCVAFYEIQDDVPIICFINIIIDNEAQTYTSGELYSVAFNKLCQKLHFI